MSRRSHHSSQSSNLAENPTKKTKIITSKRKKVIRHEEHEVIIEYPDGGTYIGEVDGKKNPHGQGLLLFPTGYGYQGKFRKGKPYGEIEIIYDRPNEYGYKIVKVNFDDSGKFSKKSGSKTIVEGVKITFEGGNIHEYEGNLEWSKARNKHKVSGDPLKGFILGTGDVTVTYKKEPHIFGKEPHIVAGEGYQYREEVVEGEYYRYSGKITYNFAEVVVLKNGRLDYPESHILSFAKGEFYSSTSFIGNEKFGTLKLGEIHYKDKDKRKHIVHSGKPIHNA